MSILLGPVTKKYIGILLFIPSLLLGQIVSSKHNLSVSGPGIVKATSEQEICKFCHIPHKAIVVEPLWDHTMSSVSYSQYTSTTFASTYQAQYPNTKSKLCLSCHDGTIAVGAISTGQINVSGGAQLDANQRIATSASSNIGGVGGTNLSDDHPISVTFNTAKSNHFTPTGQADAVNCTSCHDPHKEDRDITIKKFLIQSNSASALCLKCHNVPNFTSGPSIHQSSTKTIPAGLSHTGYTTVATNACESCHKPHSATNASRLIKGVEEATCDPCHKGTTNGGITAKNVSNAAGGPFAKIYTHPTFTVSGKHTPINASPVTTTNTEASTNLNSPNRHAECSDCHNPHAAKSGLHTTTTNIVSNVLSGAWGIEPGSATIWSQPTIFTRYDPAVKEYQICMKCHSYNGLGVVTNGVSTIIGPSGQNVTDQALEYNVNNKSVHPVVVGLTNQTGSGTPKTLVAAQMSSPWNTTLGANTMYCSDCHGNDAVVSATEPDGPHGSNRKFMLKGTSTKPSAQYWPANAGGTVVWTLRDVRSNTNSWSTNLFCVNCHPLYSAGTWSGNNIAHLEHETRSITINGKTYTGVPCVSCHVAIPHGSKRSRLIGYRTDAAPYNYSDPTNANALLNVISGFKKATSPSAYQKSNCYSTQSGCTTHSNAGGYDP